MPQEAPTVVVGNGWAALAAVVSLTAKGRVVQWLTGTGARILAPLPALEAGPGARFWETLAAESATEGSWLMECRNRAFREAGRRDSFWEPEARFVGEQDLRLGGAFATVEERLRDAASVHRISGETRDPVTGFLEEGGRIRGVVLASGKEVPCGELVFADRWSDLPRVAGFPKSASFPRHREAVGVLQVDFTHALPAAPANPECARPLWADEIPEGFVVALQREVGEESHRNAFGYFWLSPGAGQLSREARVSRSRWTVLLSAEEAEDNHEIAKRLRRLKQALEKAFAGPDWSGGEGRTFLASVTEEQVRFEESVIFAAGEAVRAPEEASGLRGVRFLTDGYGPVRAAEQVAALLS